MGRFREDLCMGLPWFRCLAAACCLAWLAAEVQAGEWPQILGPTRNGMAQDEVLADRWPSGGPPVLWQREVGAGFAGVAVAGGRVVLFHRLGDEEVVEALNASNGKVAWMVSFPTSFVCQYSSDHGPRCVPLIHEGHVYLYGAGRGLHAVSLDRGRTRWSRELMGEYANSQEEGYFGAGSTPIIEGDKLLVNVGGARKSAGLMAFDIETGKPIWKATDEQASYSSPLAATIGGTRQVVFVTRFHVLGVAPHTGEVLWRFPFGARGPTVNAASPVVLGDQVFVTASYGVGAALAHVTGGTAKTAWQSDVLSSQYTTSIEQGGYLYGIDGREDIGVAQLRCLDMQGTALWTRESFGKASMLLADGKLLLQKTDGELVLAKVTPKGFQQLDSAQVLSVKTYALPALANGLLYVRDARTLKCLDLRP